MQGNNEFGETLRKISVADKVFHTHGRGDLKALAMPADTRMLIPEYRSEHATLKLTLTKH